MKNLTPVHTFLLIVGLVLVVGMWLNRPTNPYTQSNVPTAPSAPLNSQVSFDKNNQTVTNTEDSTTKINSITD